MANVSEPGAGRTATSAQAVDMAIRFVLLGLLAYWSWAVIAPFLTIGLWSAILTVALYPLFDLLCRWLGLRWLAAALVTFFCLLIVVAPTAWLGVGLINGAKFLAQELETGFPSVLRPTEVMKDWPVIGEWIHHTWNGSVADVKAHLVELAPVIKPLASYLFEIATNTMLGLFKFIASILIAGFMFLPGPHLVAGVVRFMERVAAPRGLEMVQLAGATIRNVSRGVIGIALIQSFLGGVAFLAVRIPGAGILTFLSLLLGIVQIGPAPIFLSAIIWSWATMDTAHALIFTAYMIPVGLLDNVLRPMLMARGLNTPIPVIVIGVIGGTITYGVIGLFLGPIVLSVAWALAGAWLEADVAGRGART